MVARRTNSKRDNITYRTRVLAAAILPDTTPSGLHLQCLLDPRVVCASCAQAFAAAWDQEAHNGRYAHRPGGTATALREAEKWRRWVAALLVIEKLPSALRSSVDTLRTEGVPPNVVLKVLDDTRPDDSAA